MWKQKLPSPSLPGFNTCIGNPLFSRIPPEISYASEHTCIQMRSFSSHRFFASSNYCGDCISHDRLKYAKATKSIHNLRGLEWHVYVFPTPTICSTQNRLEGCVNQSFNPKFNIWVHSHWSREKGTSCISTYRVHSERRVSVQLLSAASHEPTHGFKEGGKVHPYLAWKERGQNIGNSFNGYNVHLSPVCPDFFPAIKMSVNYIIKLYHCTAEAAPPKTFFYTYLCPQFL